MSAPESIPSRRMTLSVGAIVTVVLVVVSAAVGLVILRGQSEPSQSFVVTGGEGSTDSTVAPTGELYVHVLGEVAIPGLYVVVADARVVDAVAAAGGATDAADLTGVNLARSLTDGEQLIVPTFGVEPESGAAPTAGASSDGLININTADAATLGTLPRIGPAIAQRIIDWREKNGNFRSVDDLIAVSGIGEKLLAGVRDQVRV